MIAARRMNIGCELNRLTGRYVRLTLIYTL